MSSGRRIWVRVLLVIVLFGAAGGTPGYFYLQKLFRELNPRLEQALSTALGVPVDIGKSSLDFDHSLGIAVHEVQIARDGGCAPPLKIREVTLRADIWELLHKRVVITQLNVDGLRVQLEILANGQVRFRSEASTECVPTQVVPANFAPVSSSPTTADESVPVNLQFKAIGIHDLDAEIHLPKGIVAVDNLDGEAELMLGATEIRLDHLHLDGELQKKKLDLAVKQVSVGRSGSPISLRDFELKFGSNSLRGSVALQSVPDALPVLQGAIDVPEVRIDLQEVLPVLTSLGVPGLPANLQGNLSAALSLRSAQSSVIEGSVTVLRLGYGKGNSIAEANLSGLRLEADGFQLSKARASVSVRDVALKDQSDDYGVRTLTGDFSILSGASPKLTSRKLACTGFSFRDGATELTDVDADLEALSVSRSLKGDIQASLQLKGRRLALRHYDRNVSADPDFEIKEILRADAPVQVKIPSSGGYEISGPVSVEGGAIVWQKKDFKKIKGSVTTLISGPLKRFDAQPLELEVGKEAASLRGPFEMTPLRYALPNTALSLAGGKASASFVLSREGAKPAKAALDCAEIDLGRVIAALSAQSDSAFSGKLRQGKLEVNADWNNLKGTAVGSGEVQVTEGQLRTYNLTRTLGQALSQIPGISSLAGSSSKGSDTESAAQVVNAKFQISPGAIFFTQMNLQREDYSVRGTGTLGFEGDVLASARVTFLKEKLGMIGSGLQTVTGLFGSLTTLDIPILISGKIPKVSIDVDMTTFLKEKSGISTAESLLDTTGNIIGGVGRALWSPFSGSGSKKGATP